MKRLALALLLTAQLAAAQAPVPTAVTKMLDLFARLRAGEKTSFSLTETEINQYLSFRLATWPRPAIRSITVKLQPANLITMRTEVDLLKVQTWDPDIFPEGLRSAVLGATSVWMDLRFKGDDGQGSFTIERAAVGSVRIPAYILQKIIEALAAEQPEHYDASKTLPLPFDLRKVWTKERLLEGKNY